MTTVDGSTKGPGAKGPGAKGPGAERPAPSDGGWPVAERALLGSVLGVPPQVGVGIAFGLTALGVFIDVLRIGTVGVIFQGAFFAGCLLAVAWVRRRSLFVPVVAPPLLLVVVVPAVVLLSSTPRPGSGITERLLVVGAPIVNAFPTLAATTAACLVLGAARLALQRTHQPAGVSDRRGSGAARAEARRPASPPRS